MLRRSVRNLSYVTGGDILSRLLGFVVTTYLARVLGVDNLGMIGFAMAVLSYGLIVADLGLPKLGTREIARKREHAQALASGVVALRIMLAFIALAGIGVFAVVMPKPDPFKFLVMSYAFALFPAALNLEWLLQGMEEMEHIAISRLLQYASYLVLVLALVHQPQHVFRVPFLWALTNLLSGIYLIVIYRLRVGRLVFNLSLPFWGQLLKAALPLGTGSVLSQIYMGFGAIALGLQAGTQATGFYTAAFRLVFFVLIIDRVFYTVVFPIVARRVGRPPPGNPETAAQVAEQTMQQLARIVLLIALPIALFGMALARPIVLLIYGPAYEGAAPVLAIAVWVVLTTTLNSLYAYGLIAFRHDVEYARNIAIGTLVSLVVTVALVALLKAPGAALGLIVGESVMLVRMYVGFRRLLPVNPFRFVIRPLAVSGALAAGLYWLSPARLSGWLAPVLGGLPERWLERLCLVLLLALALAIYAGFMYLVRGISREDIALLRSTNAD
jgi:PST family polysaccharide transporter